MILTCPNCSANFLVADHLIPDAGRSVRCGACKQNWQASKNQATSNKADFANMQANPGLGQDAASAGKRFQLPAIIAKPLPKLPFIIAMPVLALLWFFTAFYTNYTSWLQTPVLSSLYHSLGAAPTDGLQFSKANLSREEEGQRSRFVLSGMIANIATEPRHVPSVRVQLLDINGDEIASRVYVVNVSVAPGETYPFRITNLATSFGDRVHEVVLDVGHDLQLMFR
jgi:predicted Zn finger-like uncharacterized protein